MNPKNFLFVEKYRPETVSNCILPDKLTTLFENIVSGGQESFPNMTFSGSAGVGKTTCAIALARELKMTYCLINASEENGIDVLRTKIKRFATTKSLEGGMKLVILDEADHLTRAAQPALRGLIEQYSSNCRFILTCNYPNKIIDPLISRCPRVDFSISKSDQDEILMKLYNRVVYILDQENITYDSDTIVRSIMNDYPDMRKIIGKIQQFSASSGTLDPAVVGTDLGNGKFSQVMRIMKEKKFAELRKWVTENKDVDIQTFFSDFYDYLWKSHEINKLGQPINLEEESLKSNR
jgi:DNA polymerase III delta prime subunit